MKEQNACGSVIECQTCGNRGQCKRQDRLILVAEIEKKKKEQQDAAIDHLDSIGY